MGKRRPRWMTAEEWEKHKAYVISFNTHMIGIFNQELAQARADLEADQHDPRLQREHEGRILILQCQIRQAERNITPPEPAPRRKIINADRPRRSAQRSPGDLLQIASPEPESKAP